MRETEKKCEVLRRPNVKIRHHGMRGSCPLDYAKDSEELQHFGVTASQLQEPLRYFVISSRLSATEESAMSEQIVSTSQIEDLGAKAMMVAKAHEERTKALAELKEARCHALESFLRVIKPALPGLVGRVYSSERTFWPDSTCPETEHEVFPWRGLRIAGDGPEDLYPRGNSGNVGGTALFATSDGGLIELTYEGSWSRWQGASQGWKATAEIVEPIDVASQLDEIVAMVSERLRAESERPSHTIDTLALAERIRAAVGGR